MGQARAEHRCRHERHNGHRRANQRGGHRDAGAAPSAIESVATPTKRLGGAPVRATRATVGVESRRDRLVTRDPPDGAVGGSPGWRDSQRRRDHDDDEDTQAEQGRV